MKNATSSTSVLPFLLLFGCEKSNNITNDTSPSVNTTKKQSITETPEECYGRRYSEISNEREKELIAQGEKGPFGEQELVPQGLRMMIEEDCNEKKK